MQKTKIIGWGVAVLALVAIIGVNIYQHRELKTGKPVVKIGAIYPMSGAMGHIGKDAINAAKMVLDNANRNPNRQFDYELIFQDDELKSSNTVTIAQKMLNIDQVHLIMSSWSGPSSAIKQMIIDNDKILFTDSYSELSDGRNVFNCSVTGRDLAPAALDFIFKNGFKNVGLIFQQVPGGVEILQIMEPALKEKDVKYEKYYYSGTELDAFRTMVAKVKSNNHDLVILYGWAPGIVFIAREIKSQDFKMPLFGFDTVETANYDFTYFDGFYEVGKPYKLEWESFLKARSPDAVYMYDAMTIIVNTYEKAGGQLGRIPTTKEFRDTLYQQRDYQGMIGSIHLEDNGLLRVPTFLKKIENDRIIPVEE